MGDLLHLFDEEEQFHEAKETCSAPFPAPGGLTCRICGYQTMMGTSHIFRDLRGVYCRGCGRVIDREGKPVCDIS